MNTKPAHLFPTAFACVFLACITLIACAALGGGGGGGPGPVWLDASFGDATNPIAFSRWDPIRQRAIVSPNATGDVRLLDSASGVTLVTRHIEAGKVWVIWHNPDSTEGFKPSDPLPAYAAGLFRSEELVVTGGVVTYPPFHLTFLPPAP